MDTTSHPVTYTDAHPATEQPASRSGLRRDEVYLELRRRLLVGEIPTRVRLSDEKLAAMLGVSRTPTREALQRLVADRLISYDPELGYFADEPDLVGLRDLYEVRVALEIRGLSRALEAGVSHDVAILEPLRDEWRALRDDQPAPDASFVVMDEGFHVTLSQSSGNAVMADLLENINARIRRVRMYDFLTEDRIQQTIEQHLGIVEAVLTDDLADAVSQMRRHVGVSLEVVERRAARAITQMALNRGRR